jgi:hypothetical protein
LKQIRREPLGSPVKKREANRRIMNMKTSPVIQIRHREAFMFRMPPAKLELSGNYYSNPS